MLDGYNLLSTESLSGSHEVDSEFHEQDLSQSLTKCTLSS